MIKKIRSIIIVLLSLLVFVPSLWAEQLPSDKDLSKLQVGTWQCNDFTGISEYTFKPDGTFVEEGVYFQDGEKFKIQFKGEWEIEGGYYSQRVLKSNVPGIYPPYDWVKFKIIQIDDIVHVTELPNGVIHAHKRKK